MKIEYTIKQIKFLQITNDLYGVNLLTLHQNNLLKPHRRQQQQLHILGLRKKETDLSLEEWQGEQMWRTSADVRTRYNNIIQ